MNDSQKLTKSEHYWYDLIQQCRTSGKSDRQWLLENNIKPPTFYYHVKQLRKKACEIPESNYVGITETQDVVPLVINDAMPVAEVNNTTLISETVTDSSGIALRLTIQNVTVEITNQATQSIIQNTLSALRCLC